MPAAYGGHVAQVKYHYQDHDTAYRDDTPVINTWYTVLETDDVRLIYHAIAYDDDEHNGPNFEFRWTLDGNVYTGVAMYSEAGVQKYVYRNKHQIGGATNPLEPSNDPTMCMKDVPKHALHAKLECRVTMAVGTNPHLYQWCLYETLEAT